MFLCLTGFAAIILGYWRLKFCSSGRDLGFGVLGIIVGYPLFAWGIAIFLGIV